MSHPRQTWTIDRYVEELIHLSELEEAMDPGQAREVFEIIKSEMVARFPKEEREKQALIF
jgi:hypothetical protein